MNRKKDTRVQIYSSFDEADAAERARLANMSPTERWDELAVLQARRWGADWTRKPMEKLASYEMVDW